MFDLRWLGRTVVIPKRIPMTLHRGGGVLLLALPILAGGCNDPSTGPRPRSLQIVSAPAAAGLPGLALTDTVIVRLVDSVNQRPRARASILWSVAVGTGSVEILDSVTDQNGLARARWTLGGAGINRLRVEVVGGPSLSFTSTAGGFTVDRFVSNTQGGCGLTQGALWCWGFGPWDRPVGPSDWGRSDWVSTSPVLIDNNHGFVDLSISAETVCAIDEPGTTWCIDSTKQLSVVNGLPPLRFITATQDGRAQCGLTVADSTAWCFVPDSGAPAAVPDSPPFVSMQMEQWTRLFEACGIQVDSTVACWAKGGTTAFPGPVGPQSPLALPGGIRFVELAKGVRFVCGRTALNQMYCWGGVAIGYPTSPPALIYNDVSTVGAMDDWVQAPRAGTIAQWFARQNLTPTDLHPVPIGLEGNNLTYGKSSLGCVRIDEEIRCIERFWLSTSNSSLSVREYAPVQPPHRPATPDP